MHQRLPLREYYQIVAASNFKQRTRTNLLYYHAELRNYAVIGTPNKNEHDLGFFVKGGDGLYDYAPIRHLFKTQVYQLASYLGVPRASALARQPQIPIRVEALRKSSSTAFHMICWNSIWYGHEQGVPRPDIADALSLTVEQVSHVIEDIVRKQRTTEYLRSAPQGI